MTEVPHSLSSGGTHEYRFTSTKPLGPNGRQRLQQCLSETLYAVSMEPPTLGATPREQCMMAAVHGAHPEVKPEVQYVRIYFQTLF